MLGRRGMLGALALAGCAVRQPDTIERAPILTRDGTMLAVTQGGKRQYPEGELFSVVGKTDDRLNGISGMEYALDIALKTSTIPVVAALDPYIQWTVHNQMKGDSVAALVMRTDGTLAAYVSYPEYDHFVAINSPYGMDEGFQLLRTAYGFEHGRQPTEAEAHALFAGLGLFRPAAIEMKEQPQVLPEEDGKTWLISPLHAANLINACVTGQRRDASLVSPYPAQPLFRPETVRALRAHLKRQKLDMRLPDVGGIASEDITALVWPVEEPRYIVVVAVPTLCDANPAAFGIMRRLMA